MENLEEIIKEYCLLSETYKNPDDIIDYQNFVKSEDIWKKILELKFDNSELHEFFTSESLETRQRFMKFGISCFTYFVQVNFTGPPLDSDLIAFLDNERFQNKDFPSRLCMFNNNEEINPNTKFPFLLVVSETIFDCCIVNKIVNLWWCCRALIVHQEILDELSPTLLSNADRLYKLIQVITLPNNIKAELDVELAHLYLKFRHLTKASEHIESAKAITGLSYQLSGRLGKRTKHQENDVAQLTINVNLDDRDDIIRQDIVDSIPVPKNLPLKDDIRLNKIEFKNDDNVTIEPVILGNLEQKLLLALFREKLISIPKDELQNEELLPIIEFVLNQRNTYCVRVVALYLRNKLENHCPRTIERCLKQCEEIIEWESKKSPTPLNRIFDVFGTSFPPMWKIYTQFAEILLNIGLIKQSLDVYLKIELWEEVIVCYTLLKLRSKAEEIIREQLRKKPSVKLMCLLGDATDDMLCYEEAWNMSKKRSHRAQRHWGQYYFDRKIYDDAIPHFEKSLSINPLQAQIWLRLGYAALQVENWQTAATAYRRYTNLEPNGLQAWNNLAQAYLKIGNTRGAYQALLEALKCNYENWKVWENFLVVSSDLSLHFDVIRAYQRLLDLKEKYFNYEVLNSLITSLRNEVDTHDDKQQPSTLLGKTRDLMGRLINIYPSNGYVWELHADLVKSKIIKAKRLMRAYKAFTHTSWDRDLKSCKQVLLICNKLADVVMDDELNPCNTILKSVKLTIASAIFAIDKQGWDDTRETVGEIADKLEKIIYKIKAIQKNEKK